MQTEIEEKIRQNLVKARKEKKLNQDDIGDLLGKKKSLISSVERGDVPLRVSHILAYMHATGKSWPQLTKI